MTTFDGNARGWPRLRRVALLCLPLLLLLAAPAWAAPGWLKPTDLSKPGRDASNPVIGMGNSGDTIAMWERQNISDPTINLQIATRAPGGNFTEAADFLQKPTEPDLAMGPGGEAVAVWKRLSLPAGVYVIEAAIRPPGGSFSAPITVYTAAPKVIPQEVEVALGEPGNVIVSWAQIDPGSGLDKFICNEDPVTHIKTPCPNPSFVMASVRPAGGEFTEAKRISPPLAPKPSGEPQELEWAKLESGHWAAEGRVAIDSAGRAVAIWSYFDGSDSIIQWGAREGEDFTKPAQLSASGQNAGETVIGVDSGGNALAVWARNNGSNRIIQTATRAPAGPFVPLGDVSGSIGVSQTPSLAVNSGGTATLAWRLSGPSESFIQTATRPPGGSFSAPQNVSNGIDNPLFPDVAMNEAGSAIIAWSGVNGANQIVRAVVRPAGGAFGSPVAISQSSIGPDLFHPHLAMDLVGDGTAVWTRNNGTHDIVQAAGYDGSPPKLNGVSVPASATVGETLQFAATTADEWPIGPPHFSFGDGAGADGNVVSHAYSSPGTFPVTVTATDAGGTTTTSTANVRVKARNRFSIGKRSRNRRLGTVTITLTVPEPGTTVVTGKGVKKVTEKSTRGDTFKVVIKSTGKGRKRLNQTGKLKSKLRIAYSPIGGDTHTERLAVTLRKTLG